MDRMEEGEGIFSALDQLVKKANESHFDTVGYRTDRPLRRRIFYSQPYLTCHYCNTIYFINVDKTRYLDALGHSNHSVSLPQLEVFSAYPKPSLKLTKSSSSKKLSRISMTKKIERGLDQQDSNQHGFPEILLESDEKLPPCRNCFKVDGLVHGAYDFTNYILEERQRIIARRELEIASATKIVQCYRNYLFRQYGRSILQAMKTIRYLQFLASLKINALGRGRLARRRYQTEKALKVIQTSHPLLIKYSLRSRPGEKKVFWYKRKVEQELLFENYLLLIEKNGHNPPRIVVERNIIEIAKRILIRKNELIVLLQKLWRGFLSRRIVKYFQTEISRMFSLAVSRVIKIQRVFRGHSVRVHFAKYLYDHYSKQTMNSYQRERHEQSLKQQKQYSKERALISYRQDFQVEKSTRFMGKLPYAGEYNQYYNPDHLTRPLYKLQIFDQSYHSNQQTTRLLQDTLLNNQEFVDHENQYIYEDIFRKQFIANRIDEKGPLGYGKRSGEAPFQFSSYDNIPLMNTQEQIERALQQMQQQQKEKNKKSSSKKVDLLRKPETSRQRAMRMYFQQDLTEIANRVIERVNKGQPPLGAVDMNLVEKTLHQMKKQHRQSEKHHLLELVSKSHDEIDNQTISTASSSLPNVGNPDARYSKHSLKLLKEFKQHNQGRLQPLAATSSALILPDRDSSNRNRKSIRITGSNPSSRRSSRSDKTALIEGATPNNELVPFEAIPEKAERKKVIKGYQYPKGLEFNAMAWLYSNEDF